MNDIKQIIAEARGLLGQIPSQGWSWRSEGFQGSGSFYNDYSTTSRPIGTVTAGWCYQKQISPIEQCAEDARIGEFIVFIRNNITAILDYVASLEKELDGLKNVKTSSA